MFYSIANILLYAISLYAFFCQTCLHYELNMSTSSRI